MVLLLPSAPASVDDPFRANAIVAANQKQLSIEAVVGEYGPDAVFLAESMPVLHWLEVVKSLFREIFDVGAGTEFDVVLVALDCELRKIHMLVASQKIDVRAVRGADRLSVPEIEQRDL